MAIDNRAEPTGRGYRESLNGHGPGGGHGGGAPPPGGSVPERLARLEAIVDRNSGVLTHISGVVSRVDHEQDRMFSAIVGIEKTLSRVESGLEKTTETTGQFRLDAVKEQLAKKEAAEVRRSGAILTLGIGLTLAAITGIGAIIWQLVVNH